MNYLNISNIIKSTKNLLKSPNQYASYLSSKTALNKLRQKEKLEQLSQNSNENESNKINVTHTYKYKSRQKKVPMIPPMVSLRKTKFKNSEQYLDYSNIQRSFLILPAINKSQNIQLRPYTKLHRNKSDGILIKNNNVSNQQSIEEMIIVDSLKYNEIFYREHYSTLQYDDNDIFSNFTNQINIITKCIKKFINEKENFNRTDILEISISNDIKLSLHSLKISISKHNGNNHIVNDTITLPLIYMPIFYSYTIQNYISIDDILSLLGLIIEMSITNEKIKMNINDKGIFDFLINKGAPPSNASFIMRGQGRNKYTSLQYQWIVKQNEVFVITLTFPKVHLEIFSQKVNVNCYVDMALFLYMYNLNFVNWDYYVINYLFSFKHFRKIITCTFTKYPEIKLYNKVFDIRNSITFNTFQYNNKLHVYSFITTNTDNNKNVYYKIKAVELKVKINPNANNNKIISTIPFTLKQTKKYFELINKVKLPLDFLSKFVYIINHSKAIFDYRSFLVFDIDSYAVGDNKKGENEGTITDRNKSKLYYNEHLDQFTLEISNPIVEVYTNNNEGDDLMNFDFNNSLQLNDNVCIDIFYKKKYEMWSIDIVDYMKKMEALMRQQAQKQETLNIMRNNNLLSMITPKSNFKTSATPKCDKIGKNFFSFGRSSEKKIKKLSEIE